MAEHLNRKEIILLDYMRTHYKVTYEVKFAPPRVLYTDTDVINQDHIDHLLLALHIRGYIAANAFTEQNKMSFADITLTEKALNRFNAELFPF